MAGTDGKGVQVLWWISETSKRDFGYQRCRKLDTTLCKRILNKLTNKIFDSSSTENWIRLLCKRNRLK